MNPFFKNTIGFLVVIIFYILISFSSFHYKSNSFVNDFKNAVSDNNPALMIKYSVLSVSDENIEKLSKERYQLFNETSLEYETLLRNIENIENIEISKYRSEVQNDFITIVKIDCYKLNFNNNENEYMSICTGQNIFNLNVVFFN